MQGAVGGLRGVPLMQFRLSTCGRPAAPNVGALRAAQSALDRHALLGRPPRAGVVARPRDRSVRRSSACTAQGRDAFPASVMLTMAWANANLSAEEFERRAVGIRRRADDAADAS